MGMAQYGWSGRPYQLHPSFVSSMGRTTFTTTLTLGELEASYSLYRKAMRILIREGKTIDAIKRSVCWHRLMTLHHSLPNQYQNPEHLYFLLKRDIET
jgi:hypothetical protein